MFPQLGTGSPTPRPKKDNVTSARMYCGASSAACVRRIAHNLRKHVAPQEVRIRRTQAARRHDVVARAGAQHETADQPRRTRPPDHRDEGQYQQEGLRRGEVEWQRHPHRKEQVQPRQREE